MDRFAELKENIESWIEQSPKYVVLERREMEQSKDGGRLFSITFSDGERSVRYKAVGSENREGKCSVSLEAAVYAGVKENIEEHKSLGGYDIFLSNDVNSREALVRVIKQVNNSADFDIEDAISKVIEYGTQRLMY